MDDIDRFLREDVGKKGDITSDALLTNEKAAALIIAKEKCIVAGLEEASQVFQRTGATARSFFKDGTRFEREIRLCSSGDQSVPFTMESVLP